jgi:lipopolysaccharide transport periplasmic protein LptA
MRIFPLACLLACVAVAPALAEKADREKEIVLNADRSLGDDAAHTITMEGNVVVTQGTMRITAAKLFVKEDAQRFKHYTATGAPVTFRQKRDNVDEWIEGFAQRAEFDEKSDMLKLYDHARVKSNQNEITGQFISYDMTKQVAEVLGAPPGQAAPANSRVKVIIVPAKKEDAGKPAPAPPVSPKLKADTEVK